MNIFDFHKRFPDEAACKAHMKAERERQGITCKKCSGTKHYWFDNMGLWKCAGCGKRLNLLSGTMMENTKLPLQTWFMCIHLMTTTKKPFSALEMQRQLGRKRYQPVFDMMHKIRVSMGKRDSRYQLKGHIELDDGFFEVVNLQYDEQGRRVYEGSKVSQKQSDVLVMVESTPNPKQTNPHKKKRIMGFVKMVQRDSQVASGLQYEVNKLVSPRSTIISDGSYNYKQLYKLVDSHEGVATPSKEGHKKLPWVHTVISNAKRELLGTHHSIGKDYLQNYLNQFCYKMNRRNFTSDLFDRMIVAGAGDTWY